MNLRLRSRASGLQPFLFLPYLGPRYLEQKWGGETGKSDESNQTDSHC